MKSISVIIILALAGVFVLSGCGTVTETTSERFSRIYSNSVLQWKMMNEDIDYVLLLNRSEQSSPWAIRGGLPN